VRRPPSIFLVALLGGAVSACEALSGLDSINEANCAPYCGQDASGPDASLETGRLDAATEPDGTRDAALADTSSMADEAAVDSSAPDEGMPEATADSGADARDGGMDSGPDAPVSADAGPCGTVFFTDGFDSNAQGWTLDTSWSIAPTCASPPTPGKGNPDPTVDHTTGAAGGGVVGAYVCGNNPKQIVSAMYATSPAVDVASAPAVWLTFYRWLNSDEGSYMTSTVDVWDGAGWVNLYSNPASTVVTDAAWTRESFDLTAYENAALKVRFGYAVLSASVYAMSCWNVDDVMLSTVACP
jgi:hypothetical protein